MLNDLSLKIVEYINKETDRDSLDEKSTKQVAEYFGITTKEAYSVCTTLAKKRLIEHLNPVNQQNLQCCGWIRIKDPD